MGALLAAPKRISALDFRDRANRRSRGLFRQYAKEFVVASVFQPNPPGNERDQKKQRNQNDRRNRHDLHYQRTCLPCQYVQTDNPQILLRNAKRRCGQPPA